MKKKLKKMLKCAKSSLKSMRNAALKSKLSLLLLAMQGVTIWRIENISEKLDVLGNGIAQSLLILYINSVMMLSEMMAVLEKVLKTVTGDPA